MNLPFSEKRALQTQARVILQELQSGSLSFTAKRQKQKEYSALLAKLNGNGSEIPNSSPVPQSQGLGIVLHATMPSDLSDKQALANYIARLKIEAVGTGRNKGDAQRALEQGDTEWMLKQIKQIENDDRRNKGLDYDQPEYGRDGGSYSQNQVQAHMRANELAKTTQANRYNYLVPRYLDKIKAMEPLDKMQFELDYLELTIAKGDLPDDWQTRPWLAEVLPRMADMRRTLNQHKAEYVGQRRELFRASLAQDAEFKEDEFQSWTQATLASFKGYAQQEYLLPSLEQEFTEFAERTLRKDKELRTADDWMQATFKDFLKGKDMLFAGELSYEQYQGLIAGFAANVSRIQSEIRGMKKEAITNAIDGGWGFFTAKYKNEKKGEVATAALENLAKGIAVNRPKSEPLSFDQVRAGDWYVQKVNNAIDAAKATTREQYDAFIQSLAEQKEKDKAVEEKLTNESEPQLDPASFIKPENVNATNLDAGNYPIGYHNAIVRGLHEGTLSFADYQAGLKRYIEHKDEIKSRLKKYKKAVLARWTGTFIRGDEKVAELIDSIYDGRFQWPYELSVDIPNFSYTFGEDATEARAKHDAKVREILLNITEQDLADHYAANAAKIAENKAKADAEAAALENPQSLQDFRLFMQKKGFSALSGEQVARHDQLVVDEILARREEALKEKMEQEKKLSVSASGLSYTTAEGLSYTGEPRFVVSLNDRIEKDQFWDLNSKAKAIDPEGRGYNKWQRNGQVRGYQFTTEENRDKFIALLNGDVIERDAEEVESKYADKKDKRARKLLELADAMELRGTEVLEQDRKTNTARRASMAAGVESRARDEINAARDIRALANAIEGGQAKVLAGISTKAQYYEIAHITNRMKYNAMRQDSDLIEKDGNSRPSWKKGTTLDDMVKFAEFPKATATVDQLSQIARTLESEKGYKQAAATIQRLIKGKDSREIITIEGHNWEKTAKKIRDYARSPSGQTSYHAEWLRESFLTADRFKAMGIESPAMLRQAIRELYQLTEETEKAKADPVTEMMRGLIGKYKDNDFHNTPDNTARELVAMADVRKGHKILEPSAGAGHIADAVHSLGIPKEDIDTVEIAGELREILEHKGYAPESGSFLSFNNPNAYDRIIMNPPFSKNQDIAHVKHAFKMLKSGGRLVAIVSSMAGDRSNSKVNTEFREWLDEMTADEVPLAADTFKSSINATGVNTKVLVIDKP